MYERIAVNRFFQTAFILCSLAGFLGRPRAALGCVPTLEGAEVVGGVNTAWLGGAARDGERSSLWGSVTQELLFQALSAPTPPHSTSSWWVIRVWQYLGIQKGQHLLDLSWAACPIKVSLLWDNPDASSADCRVRKKCQPTSLGLKGLREMIEW